INGPGIYVLNVNNYNNSYLRDTDEFDDDVLMHEYGHFLVERYGIDNTPGGCHTLTDNNLDLRLAWSEGLGTFFPIAIKQWLRSNYPGRMSMLVTEPNSLYVDTQYISGTGNSPIISFDFDSPESNTFSEPLDPEAFEFASSEVAVLKILLEITRTYGMNPIWDVVQNYFPDATYPTSLASFWDGAVSEGIMAPDVLQQFFNERKVYYKADSFESDDDISTATHVTINAPAVVDHYLYRSTGGSDVDVFAIDLKQNVNYQIATGELRNGIDTRIRLLDEFGEPVMVNGVALENDDAIPNNYSRYDPFCFGGQSRTFVDKTSLASTIQFKPATTGRYYVEVEHIEKFSFDDNFTGHYGSYHLNVIEING
ncbi:MAG: hypothetical protein R3240_12865, partial [Gammaproteobacteria bacterium]|nr:hypothetical protein [Gammaproteobacteria bacterium]